MKIDEKRICNDWMNLTKYNVEQKKQKNIYSMITYIQSSHRKN